MQDSATTLILTRFTFVPIVAGDAPEVLSVAALTAAVGAAGAVRASRVEATLTTGSCQRPINGI